MSRDKGKFDLTEQVRQEFWESLTPAERNVYRQLLKVMEETISYLTSRLVRFLPTVVNYMDFKVDYKLRQDPIVVIIELPWRSALKKMMMEELGITTEEALEEAKKEVKKVK